MSQNLSVHTRVQNNPFCENSHIHDFSCSREQESGDTHLEDRIFSNENEKRTKINEYILKHGLQYRIKLVKRDALASNPKSTINSNQQPSPTTFPYIWSKIKGAYHTLSDMWNFTALGLLVCGIRNCWRAKPKETPRP